MSGRIVGFDKLHGTDLEAGDLYAAGLAGNLGDDPIHRLVPVGNQGGIRFTGSVEDSHLAVLFSTLDDRDWPDQIDDRSGTVTYHGDNKDPLAALLAQKGNRLLRRVFATGFATAEDRASSPVFLIFTSAEEAALPKRSQQFHGVAAPGSPHVSPEDWLVAKFFERPTGRFENYLVTLTLLDVPVVSRTWLNEVLGGHTTGPSCPLAYQRWVTSGF